MTHNEPETDVRLDLDGDVAWITLDAPARHNALEARDVEALHAHLDRIEVDGSVRVLVVTGAGEETFCAGASLAQLESGELTEEMVEALADHLAATPQPTICAMNGSAYGGGVELALCCDFRIGVTGSRLSVPAARIGVCYPLGGLRRFVDRLGLATAQRILLGGEELDASEMLRVGFLNEAVSPAELRDATGRLAARLASHAPLAVRAMKHILNQAASGRVDVDEARAAMERCATSEDFAEGLRAKRESREPHFRGR